MSALVCSVDFLDTVKCKMQILVSGSISLSGHLPAETVLRAATQRNFIWVFITPGQSGTGFIVLHSAFKVPHQCRWKFRCSRRQIILLDCIVWVITKRNTQIYNGRLTVSNRQMSRWSYSI